MFSPRFFPVRHFAARYFGVGGLAVWVDTTTTQTPSWSTVSTTQTPSWSNTTTTQTPGWTPVNTTQ